MSVGDLDESSRGLDRELETVKASPRAGELTRITVSTRPHWYQVTPWPIDAAQLLERLELILRHDWLRFGGHRRIEVTAADNLGAVRSIRRDPWPSRCPHCGGEL